MKVVNVRAVTKRSSMNEEKWNKGEIALRVIWLKVIRASIDHAVKSWQDLPEVIKIALLDEE